MDRENERITALDMVADQIAENGRPLGLEYEPPSRRLALVPFDSIEMQTGGNYLVKDLIPREGLIVAWGPPKCGKSFWTFDLGMHVALGWDYRGRRVVQGPVVYVACEGQAGLGARCEAFRQRFLPEDADPVPFYILPNRIGLPSELHALLSAIGGTCPVLVIIDTLNRTIEGSESRDEDMTAYVGAADAIRETFNCAVAVVHHCGIDGTRPRGHTSLTAAADAQLAVKRDNRDRVQVTVEYMKDGAEGEDIYSTIEVVEVGADEDGDPITSCVVIPSDTPVQTGPTRKLGKNEQTMLDILAEHMPQGLTQERWNELAREDGIGVRRRSDLGDCRRRLKKKSLVHTYGDKWFVTNG